MEWLAHQAGLLARIAHRPCHSVTTCSTPARRASDGNSVAVPRWRFGFVSGREKCGLLGAEEQTLEGRVDRLGCCGRKPNRRGDRLNSWREQKARNARCLDDGLRETS